MITIRRLRVGEAELFKQVRLRALEDAPEAFSSTWADAVRREAESWREQADGTALGSDRATFIAFSDDIPVGMAALYSLADRPHEGELLQMWVCPEFRGTGLAPDLLEALFQWARENGFHRIRAGVREANPRALKFYTRQGFAPLEEPGGDDLASDYLVVDIG